MATSFFYELSIHASKASLLQSSDLVTATSHLPSSQLNSTSQSVMLMLKAEAASSTLSLPGHSETGKSQPHEQVSEVVLLV